MAIDQSSRHSSSPRHFRESTATRRRQVQLPRQRLPKMQVTWEHFERYSGQIANSGPETPTPDYAEVFGTPAGAFNPKVWPTRPNCPPSEKVWPKYSVCTTPDHVKLRQEDKDRRLRTEGKDLIKGKDSENWTKQSLVSMQSTGTENQPAMYCSVFHEH